MPCAEVVQTQEAVLFLCGISRHDCVDFFESKSTALQLSFERFEFGSWLCTYVVARWCSGDANYDNAILKSTISATPEVTLLQGLEP